MSYPGTRPPLFIGITCSKTYAPRNKNQVNFPPDYQSTINMDYLGLACSVPGRDVTRLGHCMHKASFMNIQPLPFQRDMKLVS